MKLSWPLSITGKPKTAISVMADDDRIQGTDTSAGGSTGYITGTVLWTWVKSKIDAGLTWAGNHIFSGVISYASTTRPTSSGAGTIAKDSLCTLFDGASPSGIILCDDFAGGSNANGTIGQLGFYNFSAGGGTGAAVGTSSIASFPNLGVKDLICGNAVNAGAVLYQSHFGNLLSSPKWELCCVAAVGNLSDCDIIVGFTADATTLGIGKFGSKSYGIRYSSAVDTNFMFFSKNTDSTWAANDANNYSLSTGVAADTAYHSFRIRSLTTGVIEMKIDNGAWTTVSNVAAMAKHFPYIYVSTRTTATKSIAVDFWSFAAETNRI